MPTSANPTSAVSADFTSTWRYKVGLFLIIVGHLALVTGILLPILGLAPKGKAGLVGVLILGGEVVGLSSIVFLGKEGFKAIKSKIFGAVKASYETRVGPTRHYFGIVLLCANFLTTLLLAVYAWDAFGVAKEAATAAPDVWGLGLTQQETLVTWLFLLGEISFLIAIYVLGAAWWGKFRRIFVWEAPAD